MTLPDDDSLVLLSNPRCSTCRKMTALLEERGVAFTVRRYLDEPLDRAEIMDLLERLDEPFSTVIRKKEPAYAEAGLGPGSTEAELIEALIKHPVLLERPILIRGPKAALGRPPEAALALLEPVH
jgi:arsenate reductase (glutaredoxin)